MIYIDICVLLAVLTPEAHSATAAAFLAEASAPLAISFWSVTELHSALGLKVRTRALSQGQADALHLAIASGRGATLCSLDASFVAAAQQLGLEAELLGADGKPVRD
jgi:uncharacterized protein